MVSLIELKLDRRHYGNSELLKLFCSNVQDSSHLEILQTTSSQIQQVRLRWNLKGGIGVTWRFKIAKSFSSSIQDCNHSGNLETLQTTSDSKLLKAIWSDSQDGHHDHPNPGERFWPTWASTYHYYTIFSFQKRSSGWNVGSNVIIIIWFIIIIFIFIGEEGHWSMAIYLLVYVWVWAYSTSPDYCEIMNVLGSLSLTVFMV